jgi:hypothetical protein
MNKGKKRKGKYVDAIAPRYDLRQQRNKHDYNTSRAP